MRSNRGIIRVLFVLFAVVGMAVLHSPPAPGHYPEGATVPHEG